MNTRMLKRLGLATASLAVAVVVVGCRQTEHHSYYRYEGPAEHRPTKPADERQSSEYEMVSPGEMESEGEMVFEP